MNTEPDYCYSCDYLEDIAIADYPLDDTGETVKLCLPCYNRIIGKED